jgi:HPt (histidine-containing phosphotransfer) domain-containing protein
LLSDLRHDIEMRKSIDNFLDMLPLRMHALEQAWRMRDQAQLLEETHRLKGSAGTFGFMTITKCAERLENALQDNAPSRQVTPIYEELSSLMNRAIQGRQSVLKIA